MRRSYRICLLGDGGEIMGRVMFEADDDPCAVDHVRRAYPQHHCDLWELGRYVALIPAAAAAVRDPAGRSARPGVATGEDPLMVPAA